MPLLWLFVLGCPAHRYPDGTGLAGQLEREVIALHERVRQLRLDLEACGESDDPDPLYGEMRQVFAGSAVAVDRVRQVTILRVEIAHLWADPYALAFRTESDATLDLIATALNLHEDYAVILEAHTNDRPLPRAWSKSYSSLQDWSARLATSLAQYLVTEHKVAPQRLVVTGRGPYAPRDSNDLETGREANQRIEIYLYRPQGSGGILVLSPPVEPAPPPDPDTPWDVPEGMR